MNSSIVRYFTKGTSVTRSPAITKTGWLKCQWCGASPPPDDSPLLGCRGRIWETYIILTQMDCKSICDGGAGTISGSRYIEPDELFFWTACPEQECRGAGRQWRPQKAAGILKHRPSRQASPQPFEGSQGGTPCPVI